jgi:hypothetical protein
MLYLCHAYESGIPYGYQVMLKKRQNSYLRGKRRRRRYHQISNLQTNRTIIYIGVPNSIYFRQKPKTKKRKQNYFGQPKTIGKQRILCS